MTATTVLVEFNDVIIKRIPCASHKAAVSVETRERESMLRWWEPGDFSIWIEASDDRD